MATPNKTKTRKLDREIAKALTDLNKVFSAKDLGRKFRIKPWKVYYYKQFRKRKPFPKKKKEKILRFYEKLKKRRKEEDLQYHYRVTREKRIVPVRFIGKMKAEELIKAIGKDKLAKRMKVKPETIEKWARGDFIRLREKTRKKLYRVYKTIQKLTGIFFLCRELTAKWGRRRVIRSYYFIHYEPIFYGTNEGFLDKIYEVEWKILEIKKEDYLKGKRRSFTLSETLRFLKKFERVSEAYFPESLEACREFVNDNFKGKERNKLLKKLKKYA